MKSQFYLRSNTTCCGWARPLLLPVLYTRDSGWESTPYGAVRKKQKPLNATDRTGVRDIEMWILERFTSFGPSEAYAPIYA